MIQSIIDIESGKVLLADIPSSGGSGGTSPDLTSLTNKVNTLDKNTIKSNVNTTQSLQGALEVTDQLDIVQNSTSGTSSFQVGIDSNGAFLASNRDLTVLTNVNLQSSPTVTSAESLESLGDNQLVNKNQLTTELTKYAKLSDVGSGSGESKYGIQADYAVHYGITDCPNGLLDYNINNKEITIPSGVRLQLAGQSTRTLIGSPIKYTIQASSPTILFLTSTESSSGTFQKAFIETNDVYYQENEPDNGLDSMIAWWQPSKGLWQFKSNDTGNVWRTAYATPIANVNAGEVGITSINYIGYRIIDDDIFAQLSDIENLQTQLSSVLSRLDALEKEVGNAEALLAKV